MAETRKRNNAINTTNTHTHTLTVAETKIDKQIRKGTRKNFYRMRVQREFVNKDEGILWGE